MLVKNAKSPLWYADISSHHYTHTCTHMHTHTHTHAAVMEVAPDKLGRLLGVGGHRMKGVAEDTGTTFQVLGEGQVSVFGPSQEAVDEFIEKADSFLKEDVSGRKIYTIFL